MIRNIIYSLTFILIISSCQNKKSTKDITKYDDPENVIQPISDNPDIIALNEIFEKVRKKEAHAKDLIEKCEELLKKENINNSTNDLVYVQTLYAIGLINENRLLDAERILLSSIEITKSIKSEDQNNIFVSILALLSNVYIILSDIDKAISVNKDIIENYYNISRKYKDETIHGYYSIMGIRTLSGIATRNNREKEILQYLETVRSKNLNLTTSHVALAEIYDLQMSIGDTVNAKLTLEHLIAEREQNKDLKFISDFNIDKWKIINAAK